MCYESPDNKGLTTLVFVLLAAAGIILTILALEALAACIAGGVCEAAAIIGLLGLGAALLVIGILRSAGITVAGGSSGTTAAAQSGAPAAEGAGAGETGTAAV